MKEILEEISRGFRGQIGSFPRVAALALLGIAAVGVSLLWLRGRLRGRVSADPAARELFRHLCRVNKLASPESRMLARIARVYEMRDPVELFVRRSLFEGAASALGVEGGLIESVRRKLYEEPPVSGAPPAP